MKKRFEEYLDELTKGKEPGKRCSIKCPASTQNARRRERMGNLSGRKAFINRISTTECG